MSRRWSPRSIRGLRELCLVVHRWLGLAAALFVAVLGVTGSVLVYEEEIDRALNPELFQVASAGGAPEGEGTRVAPMAPISPGRALEALRASGEAFSEPATLRLPQGPTEPYVFWVPPPARATEGAGGRRTQVMVDPYTGKVLGSRPEHAGGLGVLHLLHTELMAGPVGHEAVGWLGVALLVLSATGMVVWLPRRLVPRRIREALLVRVGAGAKRTNYDLHRAGGVWTLLYVTLLAGTGAGLIFYDAAGAMLSGVTGSERVPPPPVSSEAGAGLHLRPAGLRPAALDTAWRSARSALPEATFTFVGLGTGPGQLLSFRGRMPSELHPNGRSFVWFDRWSGEPIRTDDASRLGAGPQLLHALYPLHIGVFSVGPVGPGVWRAVWALLGLAPALLALTGFLAWWWRGSTSPAPAAPASRRSVGGGVREPPPQKTTGFPFTS